MRWLVAGAGGMLGQELHGLLTAADEDVRAPGHQDLDITNAVRVLEEIHQAKPDVVVNCAAWTAVDDAESHPAECMAVNGAGTANVAGACAAVGARLIQLSTDYVFDGTGSEPYAEDHPTGARTVYGQSKLAGEQAVLELLPGSGYIVRTAWLYGAHGPNFVRTMIQLEGCRDTVTVVDDQHGQPTWTADVARQVIRLAKSDAAPGIYHATSTGATTWHEFAREIFRMLGADPDRVKPTRSSELGRPAPRPAYSVLGHDKWQTARMPGLPDWRQSLNCAFPAVAASAGR